MNTNCNLKKNQCIIYMNTKQKTDFFLEFSLKQFFKHQLQLKMFHFQTKYYGAHKASDSYLTKYEENLDKFMEVAQGAFGKLTIQEIDVKLKTLTDDNISQELSKFIKLLKGYDEFLSDHSELLNIRDEIVADAEQLKYLLTFK